MDMADVEDLTAAWASAPPAHVTLGRIAIGLRIVEPAGGSDSEWRPSSPEEQARFMEEINRSAKGAAHE